MRNHFAKTHLRAIAALAASVALLSSTPSWSQVQPGETAPDFGLVAFASADSVYLSQFRGQVVLLDMIGWDCTPCIANSPAVEEIWQDFKDTGAFVVLGLELWNGNDLEIQSFIDRTQVTYPILQKAGFLQSPSWLGINFDNYIVIDPNGVVRYTSVDEVPSFNEAAIRAAIAQHLPTGVERRSWSASKELYR